MLHRIPGRGLLASAVFGPVDFLAFCRLARIVPGILVVLRSNFLKVLWMRKISPKSRKTAGVGVGPRKIYLRERI